MEIQLIRNATLRIKYRNQLILIDPYLAAKHTLPSFSGKSPNPLVELPCSPKAVINDVEFVVISHLHTDHFDLTAQSLLPKELPIYCQPGDEDKIEAKGFEKVTAITDSKRWRDITISRTKGQHGKGDVLSLMGNVSGFVFQAEHEPTIYWAGDTIWYDEINRVIEQFQPEIIITHSCGAVWGDSGPIVMDAEQTITVCQAAPSSTIIATHMEALDHATVSRAALRTYADKAGINRDKLLIPLDGQKLTFTGSN